MRVNTEYNEIYTKRNNNVTNMLKGNEDKII